MKKKHERCKDVKKEEDTQGDQPMKE